PVGQEAFINAAALVETSLAPLELLSVLQALESRAGRTREIRWGARTLDLDVLLYDDLVMSDEQLVLPHPRMAFRRFVLKPATEIAPNMSHPTLGRSIMQLLEHLDQALNYVAITGVPGAGKSPCVKSLLAKSVAARIGANAILETRPDGRLAERAASPSLQTELEFLRDRCALLRGVMPSGNLPYVISDFWLGQSRAYAKELPPDECEQVESAWMKCYQQVASPKLIVFVERNFDDLLHDQKTEPFVAIQRHLREQLLEPGQPPSLMLNTANPSWNEDEVAAAILAM
ncbi:MAG: 2-amino-4-hydroxy-6-hydroxymethyldihydropteridine diphosphokinase, partial [Planctomycetota bacterium]